MLSSLLLSLLLSADLRVSSFGPSPAPGVGFQPFVSVGTGLAYNVPLPLAIRQSGQPDIMLTARFSTRPFFEVPYYDIKVGITRGRWDYELELVHHKLYLDNRPAEVDTFEITHGYNPILANAVLDVRGLAVRAGAGILLAHPQSTVRGLRFPETGGILGWYVCGPAGQFSVGKSFDVTRRFFAQIEGKVIGAWARVPIVAGSADVPNLSLHALVSGGWRF